MKPGIKIILGMSLAFLDGKFVQWGMKGKPFETVLESKVFFVTNRNYRLEKQPDRKVYQ